MNNAFSPLIPLSTLLLADTSPGSSFHFNIPKDHIYIFYAFSAIIRTDATPGNRNVQLIYTTSNATSKLFGPLSGDITDSLNIDYCAGNLPDTTFSLSQSIATSAFFQSLMMESQSSFECKIVNISGADYISNPTLFVFDIPFPAVFA